MPSNGTKQAYVQAFNAAAAQKSALIGAFDHMNKPNNEYDYNNYSHISTDYGVTPAIYHTYYPYSNGSIQTAEANKRIIEHYKEGALCMVFVSNNWANDFIIAKYGTLDAYDALNKKQFIVNFDRDYSGLDKIDGVYEVYLSYRAQWADALKELKDAGVTVIFRPFVEMTNPLHRDCYTNTAQGYESFKNVWIQLHDYMENERGLDNIIWCFAPQAAGGSANGMKFYPGDSFVDIIGLTLYSKGNEDNSLNIRNELARWDYSGYYNLGKPVGFSELGVTSQVSSTDNTITEQGDFSTLLYHLKNTADIGGNKFADHISFCSLWTEECGLFGDNIGCEDFINDDFFIDLQELKSLQ